MNLDQALVVLVLHDEDDIGPGHVGVGQPPARRPSKPTGADLDVGQPCEHLLGGGAAPSVAAAHKQDVKRLGDGVRIHPACLVRFSPCSAPAFGVPSPCQAEVARRSCPLHQSAAVVRVVGEQRRAFGSRTSGIREHCRRPPCPQPHRGREWETSGRYQGERPRAGAPVALPWIRYGRVHESSLDFGGDRGRSPGPGTRILRLPRLVRREPRLVAGRSIDSRHHARADAKMHSRLAITKTRRQPVVRRQGTVTDAVRENRSELGALGVRELHGGFEEAFGFGGHGPSVAPGVVSDDPGHSSSSSPHEERLAVARASLDRAAAVVLP
jgi:hypothetical protein